MTITVSETFTHRLTRLDAGYSLHFLLKGIFFFDRNEAMSAAFDRAHSHYEQNNGLVGMTKKAFLFFNSVTIDLEKPTDPAVRKQSYSTKTHKNGLVSTGTIES